MTKSSCRRLATGTPWDQMPYDKTAGGCGGSMRAYPVGLLLSGAARRHWLVALGIETGRVTHTHPTGFLGSLAAATFTAFAVEGVPAARWGHQFLTEIMPLAAEYLRTTRDWTTVEAAMQPFVDKFTAYLRLRGIDGGDGTPTWPVPFGVKERDAFYPGPHHGYRYGSRVHHRRRAVRPPQLARLPGVGRVQRRRQRDHRVRRRAGVRRVVGRIPTARGPPRRRQRQYGCVVAHRSVGRSVGVSPQGPSAGRSSVRCTD